MATAAIAAAVWATVDLPQLTGAWKAGASEATLASLVEAPVAHVTVPDSTEAERRQRWEDLVERRARIQEGLPRRVGRVTVMPDLPAVGVSAGTAGAEARQPRPLISADLLAEATIPQARKPPRMDSGRAGFAQVETVTTE